MKKKEWQLLARNAKNNNTYYQLQKAIIWWVKENAKHDNTFHNVKDFIHFFTSNEIKEWYMDSYNARKTIHQND